MFKWYERAEVCYAYLSDVAVGFPKKNFEKSVWFDRGWTLQELLAPNYVDFYDCDWKWIGSKTSLEERIKFDIYYIENWSLKLDVRIIFKTIRAVLFGKDAY